MQWLFGFYHTMKSVGTFQKHITIKETLHFEITNFQLS